MASLEAHNVTARTTAARVKFHCILRALELRAEKQREVYRRLFADAPTIAFSTYSTATIVVLAAERK